MERPKNWEQALAQAKAQELKDKVKSDSENKDTFIEEWKNKVEEAKREMGIEDSENENPEETLAA